MSVGRRKSRNPQKLEELPSNLNAPSYSDRQIFSPRIGSHEMTVLDVLQTPKQGYFAECYICNMRFNDWESTINHIQSHRFSSLWPKCTLSNRFSGSIEDNVCSLCQEHYVNFSEFISHIVTEHNLTKCPIICPFCAKYFTSSVKFQLHLDLKEIRMKCPVCSVSCNQEYALYSHLSECLSTFHPHLASLLCHICSNKIKIDTLADHMIFHSFQNITNKRSYINISSNPSNECGRNAVDIVFLCEICDQRFSNLDNFKNHLVKHSHVKKFCPLCLLKGFDQDELIIRHLMLRCPHRNAEQFAFTSVIVNLGKYYNMNFLSVLKEILNSDHFQGLDMWLSIPFVHDFIKWFKQFVKGDINLVPEFYFYNEANKSEGSPSDIDLLTWLTDFEKRIALSEKTETTGNEINLESIDGQVTIRPCPPQTDILESSMEPPEQIKIKKKSVELLKENFPGIVFLPDVDICTLKRLHDEAMALRTDKPLNKERRNVDDETLIRLEWEAQYLRSKNPFYFRLDDEMLIPKRLPSLDSELKLNSKITPIIGDKAISQLDDKILGDNEMLLQRLLQEASSLQEEIGEKHRDYEALFNKIDFTKQDIQRIMDETKSNS